MAAVGPTRRVGVGPEAPPAPAFVPVEIVPEAPALCGGENGDGVMVIVRGGRRASASADAYSGKVGENVGSLLLPY